MSQCKQCQAELPERKNKERARIFCSQLCGTRYHRAHAELTQKRTKINEFQAVKQGICYMCCEAPATVDDPVGKGNKICQECHERYLRVSLSHLKRLNYAPRGDVIG